MDQVGTRFGPTNIHGLFGHSKFIGFLTNYPGLFQISYDDYWGPMIVSKQIPPHNQRPCIDYTVDPELCKKGNDCPYYHHSNGIKKNEKLPPSTNPARENDSNNNNNNNNNNSNNNIFDDLLPEIERRLLLHDLLPYHYDWQGNKKYLKYEELVSKPNQVLLFVMLLKQPLSLLFDSDSN